MFYCDDYINRLEKDSPAASCKDDIMKSISKQLDEYEADIASRSEHNEDFKLLAKQTVSSTAFDLIAAGKYHVYGHFNSSGPGGSASHIHKKAVKEFLEAGYITQEDYDEDLLALRDAILQRM
jgi:hypothetical protein